MKNLLLACAMTLIAMTATAIADASPAGTWEANVGGQNVELVLHPNGTGQLNGQAGTWSLSGSTLTLADPTGDAVAARYSGNSITLTVEGTTLTFRRRGKAKAATAAPKSASTPGRAFKPKKTVKARKVKLKGSTASLRVPRGWKSGWNKGADSFVLAPGGKLKGKAAVAISYDLLSPAQKRMPVGELLALAAEDLTGGSGRLVVGPEEFTVNDKPAGRLIGRGTINGQSAEGYIGGIVIDDFGILVTGLYPVEHSEVMRASLDTVLASIRAKAPKMNTRAMQQIVGCWVDSGFESDHRTGSSSTVDQYNFNSDRTFRHVSSVSVQVPGGASYSDKGTKRGTFAIFGDQMTLRFEDGKSKTYTVKDAHGRLQMGVVKFRKC